MPHIPPMPIGGLRLAPILVLATVLPFQHLQLTLIFIIVPFSSSYTSSSRKAPTVSLGIRVKLLVRIAHTHFDAAALRPFHARNDGLCPKLLRNACDQSVELDFDRAPADFNEAI